MENRLIEYAFLEPAENLERNVCSFLFAFYKSLTITIITIPLLPKIDKVIVYSESMLFAGIYFMETHNWKKSVLIASMELVGFYFMYNDTGFQSISLMFYLITMDIHFISVANFILTKCIYLYLQCALQLPRDAMMVLGMVSLTCQYIFRYQHKNINDSVLGLTLSLYFKVYFGMEEKEYALAILYIGMIYWILDTTHSQELWARGHLVA